MGGGTLARCVTTPNGARADAACGNPRRGAHEYYRLRVTQPGGEPVEDGTLWRVVRWSRELAPGGRHRPELERIAPVSLIDPEAA